jgi:hypothetical protein
MANLIIEDKMAIISECEIKGVYTANSWKFIDTKQKSRTSSENIAYMLR